MIELPEGWESFYDEMCKKGRRFIEINYWSIPESTLNLWLLNFETNEEKFLSALLIYRLTYRNHDAVLSLFRDATDITIPNFLVENKLHEVNTLEEFYIELEHYPFRLPFRFSTIEGIDNKTGKSGTSLLRDFYRDTGYNKELNVSPVTFPTLNSRIKVIFIIDDILGSGDNFDSFIEQFIRPYKTGLRFVYIPLIAHEEGLERINKLYPEIIISPIEILKDTDSFFSKSMLPEFAQGMDITSIEKVYTDLLSRETKLSKENFFGYGSKALTHCYDNSTPNNMLPIYWYHSESWHRLFTR